MPKPTPLDALRSEARALSRATPGLGHCQALDAVARARGRRNWKELISSVPNDVVVTKEAPHVVPLDKARSASLKLNAWISAAMRSGMREHDAEMHMRAEALALALHPSITDYDARFAHACTALGAMPAHRERAHMHRAAAHAVASMAHDALVENDRSMHARKDAPASYGIEQVASSMERMHSMFLGSDRVSLSREDRASDTAPWYASSWTWFDEMAARSRYHLRADAAFAFEVAREMPYADHVAIEHLVLSLRHVADPRIGEFERMIAERYAHRAGGTVQEHAEIARIGLSQHLDDANIPFGHPSMAWDRTLADQIADDDIAVWPDSI